MSRTPFSNIPQWVTIRQALYSRSVFSPISYLETNHSVNDKKKKKKQQQQQQTFRCL